MSLIKVISIKDLPGDVTNLIHADHELLDSNIKALFTINKDMILCYSNDTYIIYVSKYLLDTTIEDLGYTISVGMEWSEFEDKYANDIAWDIAEAILIDDDYTYFSQLVSYIWNKEKI